MSTADNDPLKLGTVHCSNCGRVLKNPRSVRRGYGPECAEKLGITDKAPRKRRRRAKPSDRQLVFSWAKDK